MHRKTIATSLVAAALLVVALATAGDPPNFDFNGYAIVPSSVGGTLTMRSVLTNNGVVPTPIPLDFVNNQYTVVVTGTWTGTSGVTQQYGGATLEMWCDPIAGGTAADYAIPATFTDGTLILAGVFDGNLNRNVFKPTLGNFIGEVDFTGGSRLAELPTPQDWPCGGGWSRSVSGIPVGYDENWDGKIDFGVGVGVEPRSWDGVKRLYR